MARKPKTSATSTSKNGTPGVALSPAATIAVTAWSFDAFIADVDTDLGRPAKTPEERLDTRINCQGEWANEDIASLNRVEGAKPGWGMTRF